MEEVQRECEGVKECMFDALVTNNMELAIYIKEYVEQDSLKRRQDGKDSSYFQIFFLFFFILAVSCELCELSLQHDVAM